MDYIGENLRLKIFGASHEPELGMTLDGFPSGEAIDLEALDVFLSRRAPGRNVWNTGRYESDQPMFRTGLRNGLTDSLPITAVIANEDARPDDYLSLRSVPRPGHADYAAWLQTGSIPAGGGAWSGRMTAALCIAGGICIQFLERRGIVLQSRIAEIGGIIDKGQLDGSTLPCSFGTLSEECGEEMKAAIAAVAAEGDSLGGVVECAVFGLPAGLGGPLFAGLESRISSLLFSIPAVKGVEFGLGFSSAKLRGSENNDAFVMRNGRVETVTNHCGGLLGGVTDGMPLTLRAAFKPTPSIAKVQQSVDLQSMTTTDLSISGRHDPCVVPRVLPCVEAAAAIVLCDALISCEPAEISLSDLRSRLDRLDGDIQDLFEKRMSLCGMIGTYKRDVGLPVLDAAREEEKLSSVVSRSTTGMETYDVALFTELMTLSRRRQEELLDGEAAT